MDVFLLLDRTGSMAPIWAETVQAVNAYVAEIAKDHPQHRLTLAVFDHAFANGHDGLQFDVLRDGVEVGSWRPLRETEVTPRGMTPLFDAIHRIAAMAEARNADRTVLVIMTDGHENASRETTRTGVKAALDRIKARAWQVVFLGANFDAFDQADQVGVAAGQTLSAAPGALVAALRSTALESVAYARDGRVMSYTAADRKASGEAQVTGRDPDGSA